MACTFNHKKMKSEECKMKILYVTTIASTMGFFPTHIRMLQEQGHTVELACNLEEPLPEKVAVLGCAAHHIPFSRSPLSSDNLKGYQALNKLVQETHYDIVHCHTPIAAALTRLACRKLRKGGTRVFYTAHGFHFYTGAPLKNWLIYYPVEKLCAHWTDVLLTMNSEDYARAQKHLKAKRVEYVPGVGIDLSKFSSLQFDRAAKRAELGMPEDATVLLSVGELIQRKNHEMIIRALSQVEDSTIHYVIAGRGPLLEYLTKLSQGLGLSERVHLLGFRTDVAELCQSADLYMFPSFQEGLPVALMEAMAMGLPVICSDIRGNCDLIEEGKGGLLCKPADAKAFAAAIAALCGDSQKCEAMGVYNCAAVQDFSQQAVLKKMKEIYGM